MKFLQSLCLALCGLVGASAMAADSVHEFKMKSIDGKEVDLSAYKGKVVLMVNVASQCGLTPQYEQLEALHEKFSDKGLAVLGFPANEFGAQEPGSNAEIKQFCSANYNVTFPMFSKIIVKGEGIHPLYQWLLANADRHDDIEWNFCKFVIGKDGKVLNRFTSKTTPESKELNEAIARAFASN